MLKICAAKFVAVHVKANLVKIWLKIDKHNQQTIRKI